MREGDKMPAGAPLLNNNAEKWPTPQERIDACNAYCEHLSQGKSPEYYPPASPATIARYRKEYPIEFDTEKIGAAEREYKLSVAEILRQGSKGEIANFNAASAIFRAKNILGMEDSHNLKNNGGDFKTEPPKIIVTDQETANFVKRMLCGPDDAANTGV